MALMKIGEKPIQSFNEDSAAAQLARTLFDPVADALLSCHPWRFATAAFDLAKTEGGDFLLPTEVLRVISCSAGRYEINGNRIKADAPAISLSAIIRTGPEIYPTFFVSTLAAKLATEFCVPLTGNQNAFATFSAVFNSELRAARFIDSTMASASDIQEFSLIRTRY